MDVVWARYGRVIDLLWVCLWVCYERIYGHVYGRDYGCYERVYGRGMDVVWAVMFVLWECYGFVMRCMYLCRICMRGYSSLYIVKN